MPRASSRRQSTSGSRWRDRTARFAARTGAAERVVLEVPAATHVLRVEDGRGVKTAVQAERPKAVRPSARCSSARRRSSPAPPSPPWLRFAAARPCSSAGRGRTRTPLRDGCLAVRPRGRMQAQRRRPPVPYPSACPRHRPGTIPLVFPPARDLHDFKRGRFRANRSRRPRSQARSKTWIVPATGMAASAPRMPAIFAPISTETRIASGEAARPAVDRRLEEVVLDLLVDDHEREHDDPAGIEVRNATAVRMIAARVAPARGIRSRIATSRPSATA